MARRTTKRRPKVDPLLSQAELEGLVRYGGQTSQLAQLLADQRASTKTDVSAAKGAGQAMQQSVKDARPLLAGDFAGAERSSAAAKNFLAAELANLGAAAAPYKAGVAFGQAGADQRLAGTKARSLVDLAARGVDAAQGAAYGERQARASGRAEESKLLQRLQDVASEQGAFTVGRFGDLKEAQKGRSLTRRGQTLSHTDRVASERRQREQSDREYQRQVNKDKGLDPQGNKLPGKNKPASPAEYSKARNEIEQAATLAKQQKELGRGRAETIELLTLGRPATKRKVNGQDVTIPAIRPLSPDYVRAGMNLAMDGSLSPGDRARLNRRGIGVGKLGYKVRARTPSMKRVVPKSLKGLTPLSQRFPGR